jgi:hypothetical protein
LAANPVTSNAIRSGRTFGDFACIGAFHYNGSSGGDMDIYTDAIRDLGPSEKLQLVENIWNDIAAEGTPGATAAFSSARWRFPCVEFCAADAPFLVNRTSI